MPGRIPKIVSNKLSQNLPAKPNRKKTATGGRKMASIISRIPIVYKFLLNTNIKRFMIYDL